jgi:predicted Rossmann fold nucleotide-binding protein DprA/Smf involved in DNA uptake
MRGSEEENLKPKRHLPTFRRKKEQPIEKKAEADLSILSENDKMVYTAMESGKMVTEDNFLSLGLSVSDISTAFLNLEIYGFIEAKPGGFYVKK